ncbi:MAG: 50S ribosomal protein L11 methyltransferase [Bacteroidota bacterium]
MPTYYEIHFNCPSEIVDILIAELSAQEYDSFEENEEGFIAYIEKKKFEHDPILQLIERYNRYSIQYKVGNLEDRNWNEEWEKNYDPIIIENQCLIHATFHKVEEKYPVDIIINPKMSFGTGHHSTTYLMVQSMLNIDFEGKKVVDAGTGTGVLAILAKIKGASSVLAVDNNLWAVENAKENVELNKVNDIEVKECTISELGSDHYYDILLANINRNVLLEEMEYYRNSVTSDGIILLSGFYERDETLILQKAREFGLKLEDKLTKNNWSALKLSTAL